MARVADMSGRPVSGVVPFVVVAIVVDNVDPESLGRCKVKFPTLPGEPTSTWLRQVTPNGGAVGGMYALPEIEDEVLVGFLQGDQDHGVIIGQFWNGTTKPPTESADGMPGSSKQDTGGKTSKDAFADGSSNIDANDRRFWRSRSGHIIAFDDTSGAETLQIWDGTHTLSLVFDSGSSRIILANTQGDIHLRSKQDIYLEAGRDVKFEVGQHLMGKVGQNTQIESGQAIEISSGTDTKFDAGTNFEAKAGADMKLKASMNLTAEGTMFSAKGSATAKLEGGGSVTIRGGQVAIN